MSQLLALMPCYLLRSGRNMLHSVCVDWEQTFCSEFVRLRALMYSISNVSGFFLTLVSIRILIIIFMPGLSPYYTIIIYL